MKEPARRKSLWGWINGSIRRRLTLLVLLVCLLLIALVYVLVVQLLEPTYERSLRLDLERSANTIVGIMDEIAAEGGSVTEVTEVFEYMGEGYVSETMSAECEARLNQASANGELQVSDRSIDIGNESHYGLAMIDYLSDSILHPVQDSFFGSFNDNTANSREFNGKLVTQLRIEARENGEIYHKLTSGQMIVGTTTADGRYTVIVAANIERISQAIAVFKQLMLPVSILLVFLSVAAAWVFSRWFTRPLEQLSQASRELAQGNYDIAVPPKGHDEIATLANDFNQMAREVQRSSELQRDLLANVSHDLRTPLTLIKGYAETVRDLTGDNAAKRTAQLDVIVDETDRLNQLVARVLELSRVSSGNERPEPVLFDLAQLCDETGYRYNEFCRLHGYNFHFTSPEEACPVFADPAHVERALDNLLGNALNHVGEDGYIGLEVAKTASHRVRVEISDHGEGIAPGDLPYIFDRYYRSRKDSGKTGTGLGLSITKAIFEAQGFDYGVESTLGEGATFWFEAPLAGTAGTKRKREPKKPPDAQT